jgi:hypothetical protein
MELSANLTAFLAVERVIAETGLTPAELAAMPTDEYLRLTGRPTVSEIAVSALKYGQAGENPSKTPGRHLGDISGQSRTPAPQSGSPADIGESAVPDFMSMTAGEYAAYREASGIAAASAEGMSRASLSMQDRRVRQPDFGPTGRRQFGRWA